MKYPSNQQPSQEQEKQGFDISMTAEESIQGLQMGLGMLGQGVDLFGQAGRSRALAINYASEATAARKDAKSALVAGRAKANVARVQGAELKGRQLTAQSASGFVAGAASNAAQIAKTERDVAQLVANIELSTQDRVNNLAFKATIADNNAAFTKKVAQIQTRAGIAMSVAGLATAGFSAYARK